MDLVDRISFSSVNEFLNSRNNSLDKGRSNTGVFLYGWGDGGGIIFIMAFNLLLDLIFFGNAKVDQRGP